MAEVPMPALFHDYLNALTELAHNENPEPALRRFELALLSAMGMALIFALCRYRRTS